MDKRQFLKHAGLIAAGTIAAPLWACETARDTDTATTETDMAEATAAKFSLPALPYAASALAPHIDEQTMNIHHGKHHQGYVNKLNKALEGSGMTGMTIEEVLMKVQPTDTAIRNNGGGHYNHTLFWESMKSATGNNMPTGAVADAINAQFGSFDNFKTKFKEAATGVFGSGWAWLTTSGNSLNISSTANQDNPLMANVVDAVATPLLGLDVWEHAYYLNYQNKRADYVDAFFNIINWETVAQRMAAANS
jgi:Fe-Mn family superoxide dismutase